VDFAIIDII